MSNFHTLKIASIKRETVDAVSITFDIPSALTKAFTFIPGQYVTLKAMVDGNEVRRAYSICSSVNVTDVTVAVKAVKGGTFSVFANRQLKAGQEIEVGEPEGRFCLEISEDHTKNYIAFATGSGITPIMSMIRSVLENEPESKFVLIYGNKSTFDTIFFDQLNNLQEQYADRFFIQYVYSKEQPQGSLFGRIDQSVVNFVLNKFKDRSFDGVFICGPEPMIHTVKETVLERGYKEPQVYFELFTPSTEKSEDQVMEGNAEVTIILEDEEASFTMDAKTTVLEAALKEGLDAPYSCQGGICSSCLAKITQGKAVMDQNSILTDDEIAEGLILTCQAHPTTPKITIDYDDV